MKLGQVKLRSLLNNLAAWQKGLKTCQPWSLEHKLSHKGQLSQVYKERLHTFRRKKKCYLFSRELSTKEWGGRRSCPKLHHDFGRKKSHFQLKNEAAQKTRQKTARKRGPNISRPNVLVHSCFTAPSAVLKAVSKFGFQLIYKVQFQVDLIKFIRQSFRFTC